MPKKPVYVIQKHYASHVHYDLRLEMDGVLRSWAIPKDPPSEKGVKRLAVAVEDHELGYEKFEGTIPEGQYGAGKVELWDKGYYTPLEIKKDAIVVDIHGEKLEGSYCLVRLKPKSEKDKGKNWIFFKK
jgi:DNA ligase D-like protein (predicted 3'-phosphoesterase)